MVTNNPKTTVQSKAMPGVTFTVTQSTERRRRVLREMVADAQSKVRRLMVRALRYENEADELVKAGEKPSEEDRLAYADIRAELEQVQSDLIYPAWVAWCISDIQGWNEEIIQPTLDNVLDLPSRLYDELVFHARREVMLVPEERGNSESPSTSTVLADGEAPATTAISADSSTAS